MKLAALPLVGMIGGMDIGHGSKLCEVIAHVEGLKPGGVFHQEDDIAVYRAIRELTVVAVAESIVCWVDREGTHGTTLRRDLGHPHVESYGMTARAAMVVPAEESILAGFKVASAAVDECERMAIRWREIAEKARGRINDV